MNCVVLISSHLVPHSLSLKFIGIGQERVLSMVYVGHNQETKLDVFDTYGSSV